MISRTAQRKHRHRRVRAKVWGTAKRPRLVVFRSIRSISAQLVDDDTGVTVASASSRQLSATDQKKTKTKQAEAVGALLAKNATKDGVVSVVFDRAGYRYHGRVRALAEAARSGGLQF